MTDKGKEIMGVASPIDETTRNIVKSKLGSVYFKMLRLEGLAWTVKGPSKDVPENVAQIVIVGEDYLFDEYKDNLNGYLQQASRLIVFLNPNHYIGKYAVLFRDKTVQGIYGPQRLAKLDIIDMFPELFLNPKESIQNKAYLYNNISSQIINAEKTELENSIRRIKGEHIPTAVAGGIDIGDLQEDIERSKTEIKHICANPYWKMKKVNIIICKDSATNRFYCLDIPTLLRELADKNTATNYFTGEPLASEIVDNLRSVYGMDIEALKNGEELVFGERLDDELKELTASRDSLIVFKTILNNPTVIEAFKRFGTLDVVNVGGSQDFLKLFKPNEAAALKTKLVNQNVPFKKRISPLLKLVALKIQKASPKNKLKWLSLKKILNNDTVLEAIDKWGLDALAIEGHPGISDELPRMIYDDIQDKITTDSPESALDQLNTWIDSSIQEIKTILKEQAPAPIDEAPKIEPASDIQAMLEEDPAPIDEAAPVEEAPTPIEEESPKRPSKETAEQAWITNNILVEDTVAYAVYNDYKNRLQSMSKNILEKLKTTYSTTARQELNDQTAQINTQLKDLQTLGSTVSGIITLIKSSLASKQEQANQMKQETGIHLFYQEGRVSVSQQEAEFLKQIIESLQQEIAFIEEAYQAFLTAGL